MGRNFDPTNEKISLGDVAAARFEDNTAWSVVLFFRIEDVSATRALIAKYDSAANTRQMRLVTLSTSTVRFRHNNDGDSVAFGSISVDTWYMVAVTSDSSGNVNAYLFTMTALNDSDTLVLSGDVADLTAAVTIGIREDDVNDFDGDVAHVAYFDIELSQAQLESYRSNPVAFVAQHNADCVFYLPLLGWPATEPDWSGNGNSGTVTGAVAGDNPPVSMSVPFSDFTLGGAAAAAVGNPWYYYAQQ